MLLHEKCSGSTSSENQIWCIPENFFPSRKFDSLPPRSAQPILYFSRNYHEIDSFSFNPVEVMNMLSRLLHIYEAIREYQESNGGTQKSSVRRDLHRDVYVCKWLGQQGAPKSNDGFEYFPVFVRDAGRPSLMEGGRNVLNIGVLHLPRNSSELVTLTFLPPEPHILLPLLLRVAESEYRMIKRLLTDQPKEKLTGKGTTAGIINKQGSAEMVGGLRPVNLDENWRSEFRAFLFRLPPYYQIAIKRCVRPLLPSSAESLLTNESMESIASQCFSKNCYQKITNGEALMKDHNDRIERQEEELRRYSLTDIKGHEENEIQPIVGYGQYDTRSTVSCYLASLRSLPPPWHAGITDDSNENIISANSKDFNATNA